MIHLTCIPTLEGEPFPDIQQIHIHLEGVIKLLLNLKPYKAVGPDNLPCYFLKEVANEIAPSLCLIFQASLSKVCYLKSGNLLHLSER